MADTKQITKIHFQSDASVVAEYDGSTGSLHLYDRDDYDIIETKVEGDILVISTLPDETPYRKKRTASFPIAVCLIVVSFFLLGPFYSGLIGIGAVIVSGFEFSREVVNNVKKKHSIKAKFIIGSIVLEGDGELHITNSSILDHNHLSITSSGKVSLIFPTKDSIYDNVNITARGSGRIVGIVTDISYLRLYVTGSGGSVSGFVIHKTLDMRTSPDIKEVTLLLEKGCSVGTPDSNPKVILTHK